MHKMYIIKEAFLFEKSDPPERGYRYSKKKLSSNCQIDNTHFAVL